MQVQKSKDDQNSIYVAGLYLVKREEELTRVLKQVKSYDREVSLN